MRNRDLFYRHLNSAIQQCDQELENCEEIVRQGLRASNREATSIKSDIIDEMITARRTQWQLEQLKAMYQELLTELEQYPMIEVLQ